MHFLSLASDIEPFFSKIKQCSTFRDGTSSSDPLIGTFCAGEHPPLQATGNGAHVRFFSDDSVTAPGFQLFWEATPGGKASYFVQTL